MSVFRKFLEKINGLSFPQEYLCFARETFTRFLHVYLVDRNTVIHDITQLHAFAGYCPIIFVIPAGITNQPGISIIFTDKALQPNDTFSKKDAIALLELREIKQSTSPALRFYEGTYGRHHFVSSFHQLVITVHNRLYHKKPGNVYLHDNLYKQVQIAYAVPRVISLITVEQQGLFNCFPTDLHGQVGIDNYVISLRHKGKACRQVIESGRLLLTSVDSSYYKAVYGLGKNHMQDMKAQSQFPFSEAVSGWFRLPVPAGGVRYKELELTDSLDCGIHKLMAFRIIADVVLRDDASTLAHIHQVYASWRQRQGMPGNYLLR